MQSKMTLAAACECVKLGQESCNELLNESLRETEDSVEGFVEKQTADQQGGRIFMHVDDGMWHEVHAYVWDIISGRRGGL